MAISQVRVQVNGTWYTLTYNSTTKRYEGSLSLSASSHGQTGGYYNATAEAANDSGTTVTKSGTDTESLRLVVRETGAPSLTLVSPAQGYLLTARPTFTIDATDEGTGVDPSTLSVKLDGTAVTVTQTAISNGYRLTYTPTADLAQGSHTLAVSAADYDGNTGTLSASWTVDTVAPVLAVSSPAEGEFVTNPSLTVRGTVSDATSGLQSVTVNGTAVAVSGSFSHTLTLAEGVTTITVTATDKAGNSSSVTRTVTYDAGAPVITVLAPAEGLVTNQKTITTSGTVVETGTGVASFTINGQEVVLNGDAFSTEITLAEGEQTITYEATDGSGQTGTVTRMVTLDTIPPEITITAPAEGTLFGVNQVTVTGTVSDLGTGLAWVEVDGQSVAVTDGAFAITLNKPDGIYALTASAMDNAGNRTDAIRNITVDTAPPVVTIDLPADGATLTTRPIIVSGEAYDAGTGLQTLTVNGEPVEVTDGRYSVEIDPPEGAYTIVVIGTDNAGVSTTATADVFIDTVKPELHIDAGVNIVDWETYIISGWCYDVNGVTITVNGISAVLENGRFSVPVPLDVGENTITVIATDGVGLTVTYSRRVIRLITDRTQEDVDVLLALLARQDMTALAQWHRGAYNHTDFNRVSATMEFLGEILYSYGYLNTYAPEPVRSVADIPTPSDTKAYLTNVEEMRKARPLPEASPATPADMEVFTFQEANDVEKILVQVNAILPLLEKSWLLCGEAMCGEA